MSSRRCQVCNRPLAGRRRDAVVCGPSCRQRAHRAKVAHGGSPPSEAEVSAPYRASKPQLVRRPIFASEPRVVPVEPFRPRRRVPVAFDVFGRPTEWIEAEAEAAAHWDERGWRR